MNLSEPQLLDLETDGKVLLLIRVTVRVSHRTDIPWVVSLKPHTEGWGLRCRNFFRESPWYQLMLEKERNHDLAEGLAMGYNLASMKPQSVMRLTARNTFQSFFQL